MRNTACLSLGLLGALLGLTCGCGETEPVLDPNPEPTPIAAMASAIEATPADFSDPAGLDSADRACQVVLRGATRALVGDDFEHTCREGRCDYVWRGAVDLAEDLPPGLTVRVMYHTVGDSTWWEIPTDAPAPVAGFTRHGFALSEHLFGPGDAETETAPPAIELVAYARLPDGGRLFDHNRFAGDFDNARMEPASGWSTGDGGVCGVVVGRIDFAENGEVGRSDTLRQGGYLHVNYDLDRLAKCRGTHNGHPAWNVQAFARFAPGGQLVSGDVRQLVSDQGRPTNRAVEIPLIARIPLDAERVELWFHNFSGAGSTCADWDSRGGANYAFEILPALDDPRCFGVERETGVNTEDPHMVHMAPFCLPYRIARQADATHCELSVVGFGDGHMGHYGMPYDWLVAYIALGATAGEVLNVGMYSQFHDRDTGAAGERFSLGLREATGVWKVGLADHILGFQSVRPANLDVEAFAFFEDVRRPNGEVVRLWQSRAGDNYHWDDAFGSPGVMQNIPYGRITWASPEAGVVESGRACR